jgi:alkylation response protein AidB-like acyl-CoA dehydrogenase
MAILNEEQKMLRDAAKAWVAQKSPVSRFRKLRDSGANDGFESELWAEICTMGWPGILVPEAYGGSGLGYSTMGLVLEETGRTLTASPLFATSVVTVSALLLAGNDNQKNVWLPQLASGETLGTLAVDEGAHHAPDRIALAAAHDGKRWKLTGTKTFVLDGGAADLFVVAARTGDEPGAENGITLFLLPGNPPGLTRQKLKSVDSRDVANLHLDGVLVEQGGVLGTVNHGYSILAALLDRARATLAAEMLGAATQSFEVTLDYLKTRAQFGQVIGTFQSLQHRAAKMFAELELARSCVEAALSAIDRNANDVPQLCSLAKARAGDTWHLISNEMVQMHGGIGMTDAHDSGLYLKRARVAEALFGNSTFHRDRYAKLMGY